MSMPSSVTVVQRMAQWLVALRHEDVPANVREVARRAMLDTFGVALAGSVTPVGKAAVRTAALISGPGRSALWGSDMGLQACGAAFANGAAAHALDFDDNCYAGFVHGSAVIVPAAAAAVAEAGGSGRAWLMAYIAGAECQFALAQSLGRGPYDRGWWTTSLYGVIGATAAACYAFGLDAAQTANALGLAFAGTGGTKAGFGSDAKPLLVGQAAQTGVMSALLAREGCSGPANAFEASNGLAGLVNEERYDPTVFDTLGHTWRLLEPGLDIKRIPVCLASHAAADALRDLMSDLMSDDIAAESIDRIVCDAPPIVLKNLVYAMPVSAQQAQFSMAFPLACIWLYNDVHLDMLNTEQLAKTDFTDAMSKVTLLSGARWQDEALAQRAPEGAYVKVLLKDGRSFERFRASPVGAASDPLSEQALAAKFSNCAEPVVGVNQAAKWHAGLSRVEEIASLANFFAPSS